MQFYQIKPILSEIEGNITSISLADSPRFPSFPGIVGVFRFQLRDVAPVSGRRARELSQKKLRHFSCLPSVLSVKAQDQSNFFYVTQLCHVPKTSTGSNMSNWVNHERRRVTRREGEVTLPESDFFTLGTASYLGSEGPYTRYRHGGLAHTPRTRRVDGTADTHTTRHALRAVRGNAEHAEHRVPLCSGRWGSNSSHGGFFNGGFLYK